MRVVLLVLDKTRQGRSRCGSSGHAVSGRAPSAASGKGAEWWSGDGATGGTGTRSEAAEWEVLAWGAPRPVRCVGALSLRQREEDGNRAGGRWPRSRKGVEGRRGVLFGPRVKQRRLAGPWPWAGVGMDGLGWAGVRGWEAQEAGGANSLSLPYKLLFVA